MTNDESEQRERYDELLSELRTILPGVTVLLAFLLTAPFSSRFLELDTLGHNLFLLSLVLAAASLVVMLAPAAYHRLGRRRDRRERLRLGERTELIGMTLFALCVAIDVFVVARFISDRTSTAVIAVAAVTLPVAIGWFILPLYERHRPPRRATRDGS